MAACSRMLEAISRQSGCVGGCEAITRSSVVLDAETSLRSDVVHAASAVGKESAAITCSCTFFSLLHKNLPHSTLLNLLLPSKSASPTVI